MVLGQVLNCRKAMTFLQYSLLQYVPGRDVPCVAMKPESDYKKSQIPRINARSCHSNTNFSEIQREPLT